MVPDFVDVGRARIFFWYSLLMRQRISKSVRMLKIYVQFTTILTKELNIMACSINCICLWIIISYMWEWLSCSHPHIIIICGIIAWVFHYSLCRWQLGSKNRDQGILGSFLFWYSRHMFGWLSEHDWNGPAAMRFWV